MPRTRWRSRPDTTASGPPNNASTISSRSSWPDCPEPVRARGEWPVAPDLEAVRIPRDSALGGTRVRDYGGPSALDRWSTPVFAGVEPVADTENGWGTWCCWARSPSSSLFAVPDRQVVKMTLVKPGQAMSYSHPTGDDVSHHTAVVTAVLPDGQVLYTQHTPGAVDQSLQDRLPMISQGEGQQTPVIVRPEESW